MLEGKPGTLAMQPGGESSRLSSPSGNFSFRLWRDGDIRTDQAITRIDMLIGAATWKPWTLSQPAARAASSC